MANVYSGVIRYSLYLARNLRRATIKVSGVLQKGTLLYMQNEILGSLRKCYCLTYAFS